MTNSHLSENALQAAAELAAQLPADQVAHLRNCPLCQGRVATYQQLLGAVAQLPPPAFAFDLTAAVLAQLPRPQARPAFPTWLLGGVAALVLMVVIAFLVLFGSVLGQALQGLSAGLGAGLAVVAGFLIGGQVLELLARHRRQMHLLTLS